MNFFVASFSLGLLIFIFVRAALRFARREKSKQGWMVGQLTHSGKEKDDAEEAESARKNDIDYSEASRAYRIGDMHFSRGDFAEAEKWFIKTLAMHDQHAEALNRLGVIYVQQGNARRAEILYRKLLSITQKDPVYYANYGRCLYNQKRFSEALEAYENAAKLDATKPSRFISIGQIHYEQKDYQKALSCFVRALDLDPQNTEYLTITAELAELTGDTDRLQKSIKKLAELEPYNEGVKQKLEGAMKE
ncbi:tetratricopeptide repeat protein [Candidatus Peregrinibacteria bacterium]|nr:tetratricopeptide repeat protein [Candidatus Peregrinibacteria bacterium]